MDVPSYPCRLCLLVQEDHLPSAIVDFPNKRLVLSDIDHLRSRKLHTIVAAMEGHRNAMES